MQIHQLRPHSRFRKSKRIGRGGKRGTTSGRGTKGQKARAGHKIRPQLREIMKRIPKLRGYKFRSIYGKPATLSLAALEKHFQSGDRVTIEKIVEQKLIRPIQGKVPQVKILGNEVKKSLTLVGLEASKHAREAINKAGGSIQNV